MRTQQPREATGQESFGLKKAVDLLCNEYSLGTLLPFAMIGLYWLWEVAK